MSHEIDTATGQAAVFTTDTHFTWFFDTAEAGVSFPPSISSWSSCPVSGPLTSPFALTQYCCDICPPYLKELDTHLLSMIAFRDQGVSHPTMVIMVDSMFTGAYQKLVQAVVKMRHDAGLTQRELAKRLGREQSFVGRIETGQRRIDLVELIWIAKACGEDPAKVVPKITADLVRSVPSRKKR